MQRKDPGATLMILLFGPFRGLNPNTQLKKRIDKRNSNIIFLNQFFLMFGPWTPDLAIFDLKFGFYVKFPPSNRLERSRIRNPGPTCGNSFSIRFFSKMSWLFLFGPLRWVDRGGGLRVLTGISPRNLYRKINRTPVNKFKQVQKPSLKLFSKNQ